MDNNHPRWGVIVFWGGDELTELHKREKALEAKSDEIVKAGDPPLECEDHAYVNQTSFDHGLIPMWPTRMPKLDVEIRTNAYLREIYPIWKGIETREGKDLSYLDLLHKQDWAIFNSGLRPARGGLSGDMLEKARRANQGEVE